MESRVQVLGTYHMYKLYHSGHVYFVPLGKSRYKHYLTRETVLQGWGTKTVAFAKVAVPLFLPGGKLRFGATLNIRIERTNIPYATAIAVGYI